MTPHERLQLMEGVAVSLGLMWFLAAVFLKSEQ